MAAEWLRQHEPGGPLMSLRERVRQLREEHAWSQGELAERTGADPAQISRYENGRITPSADAVVRLAETFGVSTDYLLVDDAPRRPFRSPEDSLGDRLATISELSDRDRELVLSFIDASSPKPGSRPSQAASANQRAQGQRLSSFDACYVVARPPRMSAARRGSIDSTTFSTSSRSRPLVTRASWARSHSPGRAWSRHRPGRDGSSRDPPLTRKKRSSMIQLLTKRGRSSASAASKTPTVSSAAP
jgi:transcriptional regulator with XRE-family HTH domain